MRPLLCFHIQHLQQIKCQPLAFVLNLQHSATQSQALHDHQLPGEHFLLPLACFIPQKGSRKDLQHALIISFMGKYHLEEREASWYEIKHCKINHDTMQH